MDKHSNRVLIDVDGTMTVGPGNSPHEFAPLQAGVRAFLGALKDRGMEVVIFSARSPVEAVRQFLKREDLLRYVDGVTRTKKPSRIIVDDRAVTFRGNYAATLAEIDRFKPHWQKEHDFSSVMAILTPDLADKIREIGEKIPDEDLHEKGRDKEPHITLKWGIHGDDAAGARRAISGHGPVSIKLGAPSLFESDKHDVLKVDVDSPALHELNAEINRECPHTDTFPEYHPHVTVAYLKTGLGKKHLPIEGIEGLSGVLNEAVFSDRRDIRHKIPLLGSR